MRPVVHRRAECCDGGCTRAVTREQGFSSFYRHAATCGKRGYPCSPIPGGAWKIMTTANRFVAGADPTRTPQALERIVGDGFGKSSEGCPFAAHQREHGNLGIGQMIDVHHMIATYVAGIRGTGIRQRTYTAIAKRDVRCIQFQARENFSQYAEHVVDLTVLTASLVRIAHADIGRTDQ